MAVVPLVPGKSVAKTEEEFERRGARRGSTLLIRNFDGTQLSPGTPNLSYDLRVGSVYKDHRDGLRRELPENRSSTLFPGGAVVIETEESLHMPAGLFGYIVPRVIVPRVICPNCGKTIPQGTRVGSGRKSEGGFCSLDCYTSFYQLELAERARRLVERTKRKES